MRLEEKVLQGSRSLFRDRLFFSFFLSFFQSDGVSGGLSFRSGTSWILYWRYRNLFVFDDEERGIQKEEILRKCASGFSTGLILLLLTTATISDFFVVVCSVVGLYI